MCVKSSSVASKVSNRQIILLSGSLGNDPVVSRKQNRISESHRFELEPNIPLIVINVIKVNEQKLSEI